MSTLSLTLMLLFCHFDMPISSPTPLLSLSPPPPLSFPSFPFCPGVGGGSHFLDNGGSANRLCLSLQPEFDAIVPPVDAVSKIYGAEFELIADKLNYEVPCSVCRAAHSSTVMIPGTQTCPPGWTVQYWGHLTGGYYGDHTPGDYLCVDNTPEGLGAGGNEDGALLFYTVAACGSLPCPPYVNGRVVTCVVCSQ